MRTPALARATVDRDAALRTDEAALAQAWDTASVLVVDDQKGVRAMVAMVLRVNHYDVVEAESGAEGLRAFSESAFDAAIVDIFLAETSGVVSRPEP